MSAQQTVSVILPCFNAGETLRPSITSIIASTEHARQHMGLNLHTEIIAVDDGSKDNTETVIRDVEASISLPYITVKGIYGCPNQGAGRARQEGSRHATANLLSFLDADDEFLPRHLGLCVKTLEEDRSIGYVWTQRKLDVPIHPSWAPSLDRSTVMNLCVRKIWHELSGGFPEHPDFRTMSTEDSFYRIVLDKLVEGKLLMEETVLIHFSHGNSLDRQKEKLNTPINQWNSAEEEFEPSSGICAELEERMAYIDKLMAEMGR